MAALIPKVSEIFEQRYELLAVLGAGGIGTVFEARQIDGNRPIALKVLHPHFAEDDEFKQRFLREAQALNKLHQEHIVTVYHLGLSQDGVPYLAMELVKGTTLRDLLAGGKLAPSRAIGIARQLCSALTCMHHEGIVHRDLKPENIIIMNEPEPDFVKIIDFGLVRIEGDSDKQKLTSSRFLIGSASYMSPEQCLGKKADSRADLYSLSVCFYEMLTGRCPFNADTAVSLMYKHASEETPDISAADLSPYHPSVNEFIKKGMKKDPGLRFQTAQEMEKELEKLDDTISSIATFSLRRLLFSKATALLLGVIASLGVYQLWSSHSSRMSQSRSSKQPLGLPLRKAITISPDELKSMRNEELMKLLRNPAVNDELRIAAYLRYSYLNRDGKTGLSAARAARKLFLEKSGKMPLLTDYRIDLAEAEALVANKLPAEAIPILEKLKNKSAEVPMQFLLKTKALAAFAYASLGNSVKALPYLNDICNWQYGVSYPAICYALTAAFNLKRIDLARRLTAESGSIGDAAEMSLICRKFSHPELAELCIEHGATLRAENGRLMPAKSGMSEAQFNWELEQCWLEIFHHRDDDARKHIVQLLSDPKLGSVLKVTTWALRASLALRKVGLSQQALKIALGTGQSTPELSLLRADLLVMQKRFTEASANVDANTMIVDPETKKSRPAVERLRDLEAGRSNYRKGLNYWPESLD